MCSVSSSFTDPADGSIVVRDVGCADGGGAVYIAAGVESYQWGNLAEATQYYFRVYPYTNGGSSSDYKIDGVTTVSATTLLANVVSNQVISFVSTTPTSAQTGDPVFPVSASSTSGLMFRL